MSAIAKKIMVGSALADIGSKGIKTENRFRGTLSDKTKVVQKVRDCVAGLDLKTETIWHREIIYGTRASSAAAGYNFDNRPKMREVQIRL